jgi:N-lysine methyltransferase SETD6
MVTEKLILAGEEIYTNYGEIPQSDLLRRYGFTSHDHIPHDVVEVSTQMIADVAAAQLHLSAEEIELRSSEDCRGIRRRVEKALEKVYASQEDPALLDIFEDAYDIKATVQAAEAFDAAFIFTIWILVADDSEVEAVKASKSATLKMNVKVAWILRHIVQKRRLDYPTSVAEDRQLLRNKDIPERLKLAVDVRLGEKLILERVLEYLKRLDEKVEGGLDNWRQLPQNLYIEGENIITGETSIDPPSKRQRVT